MERKKLGLGSKLGYGIGDLGCNLLSGAAGSFITMYYTDSVMLGAAFVGTFMLFTRLLDGISDIIMGAIIDKTYTKYGKARPWVLFSLIPLIISFLLLFNVPSGLSMRGKEIYAVLTYIFNGVVCYTAVNTSYSTLCTLMSPDPNERTSLSGVRMFFSSLAVLIANSYTVALMASFGGGQKGFMMMAVIYSAVAFVCILITGLSCKEYHIETKAEAGRKEKKPLAESVKILLGNKYTIFLALAFVFNWATLVLNGGATIYFVRDVLGNMNLIAVISLCGSIPGLIVLATGIVPRCVMKFGKKKTLLFGAILQAVGYLIVLVAPKQMAILITGVVIKSMAIGFVNTLLFATVADVADFIDVKHKINIAGMTNSIVSFGMKVGVGLGSAALGWMLAWGGYSAELANNGMAQSAQTVSAEIFCFSGIPFICAIVVLICTLFLDVDEKLKKLRG
ncbi:MFS transporter [Anaerosporobacter sp.]|uniref:MFS transporter n=1 Tax=Anaerosporobacter sp. TaxID=1872529 RepID=UPI00286EDA8B|nr:glycoside-pentoside-hexuronide (GPH):cation symporter [Anaerosporobacter sp.]